MNVTDYACLITYQSLFKYLIMTVIIN